MCWSVHAQMLTERFNLNVPHRFDTHTFVTPTFCDHCGSLILLRGGLQCQGISMWMLSVSRDIPHVCTLCQDTFSTPASSVNVVRVSNSLVRCHGMYFDHTYSIHFQFSWFSLVAMAHYHYAGAGPGVSLTWIYVLDTDVLPDSTL